MRKPKKKIGVIFFHKNITNIYKPRWIEKCVRSIVDQTNQEFKIYEINYGGEDFSIIKEYFPSFRRHKFISEKTENHAEAMNIIIDIAFKDGCEYVFNTNVDDYYRNDRIEKQMEFLKSGYDVVASDFCYITEEGDDDIFVVNKYIKSYGDIESNLKIGHNLIAHPVVAFTKDFWKNNRYNPEEIPGEDLLLWCRAISEGYKFYIHDDVLLNYRLHENQITGNNSSSAFIAAQISGGHNNKDNSKHAGPQASTSSSLRNTRYDF